MSTLITEIPSPVGRFVYPGEFWVNLNRGNRGEGTPTHVYGMDLIFDYVTQSTRDNARKRVAGDWEIASNPRDGDPFAAKPAASALKLDGDLANTYFKQLGNIIGMKDHFYELGDLVEDFFPSEIVDFHGDDRHDEDYVRCYRFNDIRDWFRFVMKLKVNYSGMRKPFDRRAYLQMWNDKVLTKAANAQIAWYQENDLVREIPAFEQLIAEGKQAVRSLKRTREFASA